MAETLRKLRKLRGRNLDELRVRGAQTLAAYAERSGLASQSRVPGDAEFLAAVNTAIDNGAQTRRAPATAESLLEHFRARSSPKFFAAFDDRKQTVAELRRRYPSAEQRVIERARRAAEGNFDLLGLRGLRFGEPVDWHLDPVSGRRAPLVHWSRIGELDATATGDKKIVWELNRQQYFTLLGRAYWYTGDERYAETFVAHLTGWMERNPPTLGVNWLSSLEVAFRSISWLWALHFFKDSPRLTAPVFLRALKFLTLHATHLEKYQSTYSSPNTHLTGEALGLFYLGTLLPELPRASHWRELGARVLLAELDRHVQPDGVYFEQSSYYHRYTADFYTHFLVLARLNGAASVESRVAEKLTALLDHLMYITRPDGTTPFFGDDDGGRLVMLDDRAAGDFRAALSTATALFARPDYKYVAGEAAEETLWLLGSRGVESFDRVESKPPTDASRAFADGGYYVMRDGWTPDANYLLVDCGPHGTLNYGHAHADALSFELAARGRTLLVDPGTYTYTDSRALRNHFRHSAAHNTLTIDGESSSVPDDNPFAWGRVAEASARAWVSCGRFDFFEGEHDGYARLPSPATHRRSILFLKDDYFVMRDQVLTAGAHRHDLYFHFTPSADPSLDERGDQEAVHEAARGAQPGLQIFTFGGGGGWHEEQGWVSRCYAERSAAPVWRLSKSGEGAQEFVTFLLPRAAGAARAARAREIEGVGGRAFEVTSEDALDLLAIRAAESVETARLKSDFAWAWARFAARGGALKELILLDGRELSLEGANVVSSAERINYLVVRVGGDEILLETDARGELALASFGARRAAVNGGAFAATGGAASLRLVGGRLLTRAADAVSAENLF
jgi:hypothetical protein